MYNDADILEKILKDKRKELGPPEEEDVGSPKLKLSTFKLWLYLDFDPLNVQRCMYLQYTVLKIAFFYQEKAVFLQRRPNTSPLSSRS